jgi:hypothetical protein
MLHFTRGGVTKFKFNNIVKLYSFYCADFTLSKPDKFNASFSRRLLHLANQHYVANCSADNLELERNKHMMFLDDAQGMNVLPKTTAACQC